MRVHIVDSQRFIHMIRERGWSPTSDRKLDREIYRRLRALEDKRNGYVSQT